MRESKELVRLRTLMESAEKRANAYYKEYAEARSEAAHYGYLYSQRKAAFDEGFAEAFVKFFIETTADDSTVTRLRAALCLLREGIDEDIVCKHTELSSEVVHKLALEVPGNPVNSLWRCKL